LRDVFPRIEAAGVRLVVVGNGSPAQALDFRESEGLPFSLWVDQQMHAYAAAGLRRGITKALSHRSVGHTIRAMRKGFRQTKVAGDPWQLGGVFLLTPAGEVRYEQRSREAGDHPPMDDVLAAIAAL
jgi:hypothetical protein